MKQIKRDHDGAVADFSEAIRVDPSLAEAYLLRGQAWLRRNQPAQAVADFTDALRLEPVNLIVQGSVIRNHVLRPRARDRATHDAIAYFGRGFAQSLSHNLDAAIADYSSAIKRNPRYAQALLVRGSAYLVKADYDRAIADFTRVANILPGSHQAIKPRGLARFFRGEHAFAAADFAETLKLKPGDPESTVWLYLSRTRLAGASSVVDARGELARNVHALIEGSWPRLIAALYLEEATPEEVFAAVPVKGKTRAAQRCQASFFVGHWRVLKGERAAARMLMKRAIDRCAPGSNERLGAVAELARLGS